MNPKMSYLGQKLREVIPEHFAQKGPFEGRVYKIGKKGDPIVRAPNGDDVVIDDYNGLERPNIGDRVKAKVIHDGKGKSYSFGRLLEIHTLQSRTYLTAQSNLEEPTNIEDKLKGEETNDSLKSEELPWPYSPKNKIYPLAQSKLQTLIQRLKSYIRR